MNTASQRLIFYWNSYGKILKNLQQIFSVQCQIKDSKSTPKKFVRLNQNFRYGRTIACVDLSHCVHANGSV